MAEQLVLFDGSNYLRRKYEEERTISSLRASVRDVRSILANSRYQAIYVWDGFRANDYRKGLYPLYKGNRSRDGLDDFYKQIDIFKQVLKHLPIITVDVPGYEADDIIGFIAKGFMGKIDKIHVKSTDKDFEQLEGVTHEGTTLDLPSDQIIPYKILVGDVSDNIKGVPGFGKKTWEKTDKDHVIRWVASDFDPKFSPESFSPKIVAWCADNQDLLRNLQKACEFREVPDELVTKHMHFGKDNPAEVERILQEHLA